jgi:hypothetical protein
MAHASVTMGRRRDIPAADMAPGMLGHAKDFAEHVRF